MKDVFLFELRLRARQVSPYLFFLLLFSLALTIFSTDAIESLSGDGRVKVNAPYLVLFIGSILSLFGGMIVSSLMGTAIYRDFETKSYELFFTTHLTPRSYFMGRFWGAFLVTVLVFLGIPLGILAGTVAPWAKQDLMGPFRADTYLMLIGAYIIPNLLVTGALFFVLGALTRSLVAIYVQALVFFVGYMISLVWLNQLDKDFLTALLDPYGISPLSQFTRYWTQYQKNTLLPELGGAILKNRLLWIGVALTTLALGERFFAFARHTRAIPHRQRSLLRLFKRQNAQPEAEISSTSLASLLAASPSESPASGSRFAKNFVAFIHLTRLYYREIAVGIPFFVVTLLGILLFFATASSAEKILNTPVLPVTRVMLESVAGSLGFIVLILITFYSGELAWRERVLDLDQITDTLPLPTIIAPLAKASAMLLMILVLVWTLIFCAILVQASEGYFNFEIGVYTTYLFLYLMPSLIQILMTAMFVHAVVNQKFVGHVVTVSLLMASTLFSLLKWERYLLLYLYQPEPTYSDLNGFGPFQETSFWYNLYWTAITFALFLIGSHVWVRGKETRLIKRWESGNTGHFGKVLLGASVLVAIGSASYIFYNTDVLNRFRTEHLVTNWRERYERLYKADWEKRPMPRIVGVKLDVDLRPETQQYTVTGTYRLKNKTAKPMDRIVVDVDEALKLEKLEFSVPSTSQITDTLLGFRAYRFDRPLQPGEEITLSFVLKQENRGFRNSHIETAIAENGTFLTMPVPKIGYQPDAEITSENERRERDLPDRLAVLPATDVQARQNVYIGNDADWIDFEATVRTSPDQVGIAPGYLQKEWTENGRRCFHYKMDAPIRNFYSILSARYAVARDTWRGKDGRTVSLEIYYHPPHTFNLQHMFDGMKAALSYCSENFSPYQFRQLRIIEFPAYAEFAQSFPNTIPYSEGLGFIAKINDEEWGINYPFYITAHETAHQWWAHQVLGANVAGATLLSESLAEYSSLKALETRYGQTAVDGVLRYNHESYLQGRGEEQTEEQPLSTVGQQPYLHYNKGALAFHALAKRIGEKRLNRALARFVQQHAYKDAPYPIAPELLKLIRSEAEAKDQNFITDTFEKITIYDIQVTSAQATPLPGGKWRVTATIYATKAYADGAGREDTASVDEIVEVTVVGPAATGSDDEDGKTLARQKKRIGSQYTTVAIEVNSKPATVKVDPFQVVVDRYYGDNSEPIQEKAPDSSGS
ncbi:MAG: M1 family metallopeptidase [Armatimonadaceae bacterium]